jgi:hypothetical protein
MLPKYTFDHSWGKFLRRKYYVDPREVEAKWKRKERFDRIRLQVDRYGAAVAYDSDSDGY